MPKQKHPWLVTASVSKETIHALMVVERSIRPAPVVWVPELLWTAQFCLQEKKAAAARMPGFLLERAGLDFRELLPRPIDVKPLRRELRETKEIVDRLRALQMAARTKVIPLVPAFETLSEMQRCVEENQAAWARSKTAPTVGQTLGWLRQCYWGHVSETMRADGWTDLDLAGWVLKGNDDWADAPCPSVVSRYRDGLRTCESGVLKLEDHLRKIRGRHPPRVYRHPSLA